jgi:hypothetical protein
MHFLNHHLLPHLQFGLKDLPVPPRLHPLHLRLANYYLYLVLSHLDVLDPVFRVLLLPHHDFLHLLRHLNLPFVKRFHHL